MLPKSCQEFRAAFVPKERAEAGSHRASCPRCERWATALEADLAPDVRVPLPRNLAQRLRTIPEDSLSCNATEALYAEARRRAAGRGSLDSAAARHLERCAACRRLYGVLEDALLETPRALPRELRASLSTLARPWAPPRWLRDARYAAAACLLLASSLTFAVGDAAAALRRAEDTVRTVRTSVGESTAVGPRWEPLEGQLETLYREGRLRTSRIRSDLSRIGHQALEELTTWTSRLPMELEEPISEETTPSPSQGDR